MNRRSFIAGLSAAALAPRPALSAAGGDAPSLRLGVLSDIHVGAPKLLAGDSRAKPFLGTGASFEKALRAFRERGVDAVVIAGDLTECGLLPEI